MTKELLWSLYYHSTTFGQFVSSLRQHLNAETDDAPTVKAASDDPPPPPPPPPPPKP